MKTKLICSLLFALGLAHNAAADAMEGEVLMSAAERATVEANVEYIDFEKRDIKILMPEGQLVEFNNISTEITAFDKAQLNDKVNVSGSEAVVIVLKKGGAGVRKIEEGEGRDTTTEGVGILKTRAIYNDIISVDVEGGKAVLKTPENKMVTLPVENKELLAKAAAGDQLVIITRMKSMVWAKYK